LQQIQSQDEDPMARNTKSAVRNHKWDGNLLALTELIDNFKNSLREFFDAKLRIRWQ